MTIRKISEPPAPPCRHPEHKVPAHIVLSPGTYEHRCPGCGARTRFTVHGAIWKAEGRNGIGVPPETCHNGLYWRQW